MRFKSCLLSALAACSFVASGSALAQFCVGFIDVPSASGFCQNVEWIRNRGVTLGCEIPNSYCPDRNVTRLQMAAFLNRLGTALTPVILTPGAAAAAPVNLTPEPVVCSTGDYAVTGFPRRAYVHGLTNLSLPTPGGVIVMAQLVYSTNGGGSWASIPDTDHYQSLYTGATPGNHETLTPFGFADFNPGTTVRFGLQLVRWDAGSSNVTASCNVRVAIGNRNGTSPPL